MEVYKKNIHYSNFSIWESKTNDRNIFRIEMGNFKKRFLYLTKRFDPEKNPIWRLEWIETYFKYAPSSTLGFNPIISETNSNWVQSLVIYDLANIVDILGQKNEIKSIYGDIYITQKGTRILVESNDKEIINLVVPTGYRGSSSFKVLTPNIDVIKYYIYESPNGSLGTSECGLIIVPKGIESIEIEFRKSGRRINYSHGIINLKKVSENSWNLTQYNYNEYMDLKNLDI